MTALDSVLSLLQQARGDAVLLHAGKAPVLLSSTGQSAMPLPVLTADDIRDIARSLVPASVGPQLDQAGTAQFIVPASAGRPALDVTAIGKGDDTWFEIKAGPEPPAVIAPQADASPAERGAVARRRLASADDLDTLVAQAAARGDATLFLQAGMAPAIKIDGTVRWLDEFAPLDAGELTAMLTAVARTRADGPPDAAALHWRVADRALVECRVASMSARPEATVIVRSTQPIAAEQLGIPAALAEVCRDDRGLVLVAGTNEQAWSRTCHSLIDLVNRDRSHHIVVLEPAMLTCHSRGRGYVGQRVVTEAGDGWARAIADAIAEQPDVLMTTQVPSWAALQQLLDYAADAMVIVPWCAASAIEGLAALVAIAPAAERSLACARVADALTAAVGQREMRSRGGGAARSAYELVIGTDGVRDLVRRGAFDALAISLERGVDGMISMAAAVLDLVRRGRLTARQGSLLVPGLAVPDAATAPAPPPAPMPVSAAGAAPSLAAGDADTVDLSDLLAAIADTRTPLRAH